MQYTKQTMLAGLAVKGRNSNEARRQKAATYVTPLSICPDGTVTRRSEFFSMVRHEESIREFSR